MTTYKETMALVNRLAQREPENLKMNLLTPALAKEFKTGRVLADKKLSANKVCYYCGKSHIVRNGHKADGIQRYRCRDCKKTYSIPADSIVYGIRKDILVWQKYVECTINGASIREAASICGISTRTAFNWRRRMLEVLQKMANATELD